MQPLVRAVWCLASLTFACSLPDPVDQETQAIQGGAATEHGDWPGVVWLDNGCTGVLVAPDLVVYAGHCGDHATSAWFGKEFEIVVDDEARTARVVNSQGGRQVATSRCQVHPNIILGDGTDVAFCVLSNAALDQSLIPPIALGCSRERIQPGSKLTLVGFGTDGTGAESLGTKRSVEAEVRALGKELEVGDEERGTCPGDSGGPAFVALAGEHEWALAGVLSSGQDGSYCGIGFFTDFARVVSWLETASERDLTSRSRSLCRDSLRARGGCSQSRPVAPAPGSWLLIVATALTALRLARRLGRGEGDKERSPKGDRKRRW